jgi:hypothetical protein
MKFIAIIQNEYGKTEEFTGATPVLAAKRLAKETKLTGKYFFIHMKKKEWFLQKARLYLSITGIVDEENLPTVLDGFIHIAEFWEHVKITVLCVH